ncbi:MAG: hypothetical protein QM796_18790 [Chthoniobacteraceae bacterium]
MSTTTYNIVGSGNIQFGTGELGTTYGVIVSASNKLGGDKLELKDEHGNVFVVVYFNDKNECEIQVIFDSGTALPVRGDNVSLAGLTDVLVDEVTQNWANEKEQQATIRGTKYAHLTVS